MPKYCEDCGTKMWGHRCPNCHEEAIILDQYHELGMKAPSEEFVKKAIEQESDAVKKATPDK